MRFLRTVVPLMMNIDRPQSFASQINWFFFFQETLDTETPDHVTSAAAQNLKTLAPLIVSLHEYSDRKLETIITCCFFWNYCSDFRSEYSESEALVFSSLKLTSISHDLVFSCSGVSWKITRFLRFLIMPFDKLYITVCLICGGELLHFRDFEKRELNVENSLEASLERKSLLWTIHSVCVTESSIFSPIFVSYIKWIENSVRWPKRSVWPAVYLDRYRTSNFWYHL